MVTALDSHGQADARTASAKIAMAKRSGTRAAVREAVQQTKGPVFIATPDKTGLDDVATRTYRAAPDDVARLGRNIGYYGIAGTAIPIPAGIIKLGGVGLAAAKSKSTSTSSSS